MGNSRACTDVTNERRMSKEGPAESWYPQTGFEVETG